MSLEGFSKKGMELGNNPEGISETKNDLRQQYLSAIKRLALEKMKNDILFEGKLGATIRNLSSMGLNITRENILKDIEMEITKQRSDLTWDEYTPRELEQMTVDVVDETKTQIDSLKNNLSSIFESTPVQEPKLTYTAGGIPREPAIQSTQSYENTLNNTTSRISQPSIKQAPVDEQEIREQLKQAQKEMSQQLEWAKQQPNEPTMSFTGNLENLSDDVKKRIIQQMESRGEVIISGIDNIYQDGNYIVVDAKDNQGRFTGTEFTLDDFAKLVNQPSTITKIEEISQRSTDNINEPPIQEQPKVETPQSIEQSIQEQPQQVSQVESERILQEQQTQMKNQIISQIMNGMNNAGEFSFGDISMGERMSIMQNVQNKLNAKSMDELQMLLSAYQEQNNQEETMHSGMHR